MSLQFSNFLPTLLLLIGRHMEFTEAQSFSVFQTPSSLNVVEGTNVMMECKIEVPNPTQVWFIEWTVNRAGGKMRLNTTNHISIVKNATEKWSSVTLQRADMADSGIYVCEAGSISELGSNMSHIHNNGTQVTVNELTNLMVEQTPVHTIVKEGTNVTIKCRFRTVRNYSTMDVRWRKDGQNLTRERDSLTMIQDLESGFASLTLKNTKEDDSGFYVCEVGSRSRNLSGSGTPSHVVIKGQEKKQLKRNDRTEGDGAEDGARDGAGDGARDGAGTGVGAGVGAGVGGVLALLIGVFVWKKKQKSQGTPLATSEPDSVSTKEARIQHPPLASQVSDVTYADLLFNKRDVKPDAEVIYAEVKLGRK